MLLACSFISVRADDLSLPEKTFESTWKAFDNQYALLGVKNIDWNAIYRIYRSRVTSTTTDDELFEILSHMLSHLNDNHVNLTSKDENRYFNAGYLHQLATEYGLEDFLKLRKLKPVPESYFTNESNPDLIIFLYLPDWEKTLVMCISIALRTRKKALK